MRKLDTGQLLQLASVLVTSSHGEAVLCVQYYCPLYWPHLQQTGD